MAVDPYMIERSLSSFSPCCCAGVVVRYSLCCWLQRALQRALNGGKKRGVRQTESRHASAIPACLSIHVPPTGLLAHTHTQLFVCPSTSQSPSTAVASTSLPFDIDHEPPCQVRENSSFSSFVCVGVALACSQKWRSGFPPAAPGGSCHVERATYDQRRCLCSAFRH